MFAGSRSSSSRALGLFVSSVLFATSTRAQSSNDEPTPEVSDVAPPEIEEPTPVEPSGEQLPEQGPQDEAASERAAKDQAASKRAAKDEHDVPQDDRESSDSSPRSPLSEAATHLPQPTPRSDRERLDSSSEAEEESHVRNPYPGTDQTGTPPPPPRPGEEEPPKKWDPDYDGRDEPTRGEDVLIWLPRAPLLPIHLILDYGIRRPIVWAITKAEQYKLPQRIEGLLTFDDGRGVVFPSAFYDAGRGFWAGLNLIYKDLGTPGSRLKAMAGYGSNDWILAQVSHSIRVFEGDTGKITFRALFHRDPTMAFTGFGPDTDIDDQVFFGEEKLQGGAELRVALAGLSQFHTSVDVRRAKLRGGRDPSIRSSDSPFETTNYTGFESYFHLGRFEMGLDLDSREVPNKNDNVPGSGVHLGLWGSYNYSPGPIHLSFARYGVEPKFSVDFTGSNHVLTLGAYAEAVSRVDGDPVPLSEHIALGGNEHLRGFIQGRFRGGSALVYSLDYSWPLFSFAHMFLFSDVGNAYRGLFEDFSHESMALSYGTGLKSVVSREFSFFLAVGFGTNQIDRFSTEGFRTDKTRLFFGATQQL